MNTIRHIAFTTALLGCSLAAQAAGTLLINPATSTVAPGNTFTVQVSGSAFTDNVVGGGFNLSFDPGVLSLLSVTVDTAVWEFVSSNGQINNAAGTLSDVYFNSFRPTLPTGSFAVATPAVQRAGRRQQRAAAGREPQLPVRQRPGQRHRRQLPGRGCHRQRGAGAGHAGTVGAGFGGRGGAEAAPCARHGLTPPRRPGGLGRRGCRNGAATAAREDARADPSNPKRQEPSP